MKGKTNTEEGGDHRLFFESAETNELLEIWKENDGDEWTDQDFAMIETILRERKIDIPEQDKRFYCEACDKRVSADAKFCQHCGAILSDNCMVCDKPLPNEAKYCPHCGSTIKEQSHASRLPNTESLIKTLRWGLIAIAIMLAYISYLLNRLLGEWSLYIR